MPTINNSSRLVKRVILSNMLANKEGLAITPLLAGPHGIGKSQVLKAVANALGGYCFTVECGSLKEGEITGLPFASANEDGTSEVRFVKYYSVNKIYQLQKHYYKKAITDGFLGGSIRLETAEDGSVSTVIDDGKNKTVVERRDIIDLVEDGEDNRYKFGECLDGKTKMALIESGEIRPVVLFFDELNRCEQYTMKELMNIILNKSVNGYDLPWWVAVVAAVNPSSQNSTYATNEFDDAQNDRFLRLKVDAALEEWIDYSLANKINTDIVEAIALAEPIFMHKEKGHEDTTEMHPSPRSWEMVSILYDTVHEINNTKFFNSEERKFVEDDLRVLIRGKVGDSAARTLLETIARKENNIKPADILTCKKPVIDPAIVTKFNNQKRLTQKIIADNVVNYIFNIIDDIEKGKTSSDPKKKEQYVNFMGQVKEFMNMLDTATQIVVVKKLSQPPYRQKVYTRIASAFSSEVLANVISAKDAINDLTNDK